jgi:hypothetical protein
VGNLLFVYSSASSPAAALPLACDDSLSRIDNKQPVRDSAILGGAMGRVLQCTVRIGGKRSAGKALLETNEIVFRGDLRLEIPLASIKSAVAKDSELHLKWPDNAAIFELGEQAEKWAHAILHPKSVAEKLGVKPGSRISLIHLPSPELLKGARKSAAAIAEDKPLKDSDVIFCGAEATSELTRIKKLIPSLARNGALWIVYPKGLKEITELQVLAAGREAGLVDIKVVSYSPTHTALKFVRPKAKR